MITESDFTAEELAEAAEIAPPSEESLKTIAALAALQLDQEARLEKLAEEIKSAAEQLRVTKQVDLPNAMKAVNMKEFTLSNGAKIKLKDNVFANISEDRSEQAFKWLRANKSGDIIKNQLTLDFKAGEEELATDAAKLVQEKFPTTPFKRKEAVHASTLKSFVKEKLDSIESAVAAGETPPEFPEALFGVFRVTESEIVLPSASRASGKSRSRNPRN